MTSLRIAALVALLSAGGAFAAEPTISDCRDMAKQVKTALTEHAQSANYHNAVVEEQFGQQLCTRGFGHDGVIHYAKALELLQANKT